MAQTVEYQTTDLRGKVDGGASIEFLNVEIPSGPFRAPFAVVRYALNGEEQEYGLRLDLDKGAFLDHFEDEPLKEAVLRRAAPQIVNAVYESNSRGGERAAPPLGGTDELFFPHAEASRQWMGGAPDATAQGDYRRIFMCFNKQDSKWAEMFRGYLERNLRGRARPSEFELLDVLEAGQTADLRRRPDVPSIAIVFVSRETADFDDGTGNELFKFLGKVRRSGTPVLTVLLDTIPQYTLNLLSKYGPVNAASLTQTRLDRPKEEVLSEVARIVEESTGR